MTFHLYINYQEYVSRLKKTYSTLSQVTNKIIAEEGTPRGDKGEWATNTQNIINKYKNKLNNTKKCNYVLQENGPIPACFD